MDFISLIDFVIFVWLQFIFNGFQSIFDLINWISKCSIKSGLNLIDSIMMMAKSGLKPIQLGLGLVKKFKSM